MPVLFAIDVEARKGEAVAILGANGGGKSTSLPVITDLSVRRGGRDVSRSLDPWAPPSRDRAARDRVRSSAAADSWGLTVRESLQLWTYTNRRE